MRTFYEFRSESEPELHGFTEDANGGTLPPDKGPWTLVGTITPDGPWARRATKAVVVAGIVENGFSLQYEPASSNPIIESDRVEGTAVFDAAGRRIGEIKRLLIEKVSGHVLHAEMSFGGFLGLGTRQYRIPWSKLSYDTQLGGYRTDLTEEQVRGDPAFLGDEEVWPDRDRSEERDDWRMPPLV